MFDSHCHLDFTALAADLVGHLGRGRAAGIHGWFVPGCEPRQWSKLARVRQQTADIHVGVGLHPYWSGGVEDVDELVNQLRETCLSLGAVALGECGLDKGRGAPLVRQAELFEAQLTLARELDLPVVVHQVGAQEELLRCLGRVGLPRAGGVVHGFAGDVTWARTLVARGLLLGVGLSVLRRDRERLRAAIVALPLERLLLETDAPDQAVSGQKGQGVPSDLVAVCSAVAELKSIIPEIVGETTERTARALYRIS